MHEFRQKDRKREGKREEERRERKERGEDGGGRERKEGRKRDCFMLMFGRNQHNTVKQLSFNKK